MTNEEILKKAIEKAMDNGWKPLGDNFKEWTTVRMVFINFNYCGCFIFLHDFAKAFWGERTEFRKSYDNGEEEYIRYWKHHLQQLVLEEDPIKYLEKFL